MSEPPGEDPYARYYRQPGQPYEQSAQSGSGQQQYGHYQGQGQGPYTEYQTPPGYGPTYQPSSMPCTRCGAPFDAHAYGGCPWPRSAAPPTPPAPSRAQHQTKPWPLRYVYIGVLLIAIIISVFIYLDSGSDSGSSGGGGGEASTPAYKTGYSTGYPVGSQVSTSIAFGAPSQGEIEDYCSRAELATDMPQGYAGTDNGAYWTDGYMAGCEKGYADANN